MSKVAQIAAFLKDNTPAPVFNAAKGAYRMVMRPSKKRSELDFWIMEQRRGNFKQTKYQPLMRALVDPIDGFQFEGKVIADFGCGPLGSLAWLENASEAIGIDVLVPEYYESFGEEMTSHHTTYVTSTENYIPIVSDHVDVLFAINSLDHVDNLPVMLNEIARCTKPGGYFVGALNLGEEPTATEPQALTYDLISDLLAQQYDLIHVQEFEKNYDDAFAGIYCRQEPLEEVGKLDRPTMLWVVARLKENGPV